MILEMSVNVLRNSDVLATMLIEAQRLEHERRIDDQEAIFAAYRHGWHVAAAGGMLCDCATSDEAAGWQASRDADAAMRAAEVRCG